MIDPCLGSDCGGTFYVAAENTDGIHNGAHLRELYEQYILRKPIKNTWEYRVKVIRLAKYMFGNFDKWYAYHTERRLTEYQIKFLEDTLRFIDTGKRRYSISVMSEMIRGSDRTVTNVGLLDDIKPLKMLGVTSTTDMLSLWCSRQGGFNDMLCTLYVLFGISREY